MLDDILLELTTMINILSKYIYINMVPQKNIYPLLGYRLYPSRLDLNIYYRELLYQS